MVRHVAVCWLSPCAAPRRHWPRWISKADGRRVSTRTRPSAAVVPTSASTRACRSTTRPRLRGDSWSASLWTVPEHQCIPHPADYGPNFSPVRIWKDLDPVTKEITAYHTEMGWMNPVRTIWMDGRPHPPAHAPHTWQGFSTGKWDGDMLTVTTTHLKPGYIRRNGLARSEKATLLEHFTRHGNVLTWISIVSDPVYLTEPFIKSRNFSYDPGYQMALYPCSVDVEVERPAGRDSALPARHAIRTSTSSRSSGRCRAKPCAAVRRRCTRSTSRSSKDDAVRKPPAQPASPQARRQAMMRALAALAMATMVGGRARARRLRRRRGRAIVADTREHVHARRARREHHSPGRTRWRSRRRSADGRRVRASLLAAIRRLSDKPGRFIVNTTRRRRPRRRQRSDCQVGSDARRREHQAGHGHRYRRRADLRAREHAEPAERIRRVADERFRPTATSSSRRTCSSTARRCSCCTCRPRTPTATPSSSSAAAT